MHRTTRLPALPSRNALRVAILAALSAAPVLHATPIAPDSALDASEFLVNTSFTAGGQLGPRVARDAAGDFVVVWNSGNQASSTSSYDIYAQRYDAAGQPQGSAFLVNTFTTGSQSEPGVAMDAAGDFVVVWESPNQASSTSSYDIYAQRFNAAGQHQGSEFRVNTIISGPSVNPATHPAVAMDAAGDFVVAWQRRENSTSVYDVYARQFTTAGSAVQANEFPVNTFTSDRAIAPTVAVDAGGDFVVAWQSYKQASSTGGFDIYARQWGSNGHSTLSAVQASEFLVNTVISPSATANRKSPAVAMDAAGDFVVAWESYNQLGTVFDGYDIYARQYQADGTAVQSSEFLVNTFTLQDQLTPSVTMDATGDFLVAWNGFNESGDGYYDVFARQYTPAGAAVQTSGFLVNTYTVKAQHSIAVAMDAAGDYVTAWQSNDQASSASNYDIYARRFQGPETVDLAATLAASPSSVTTGGSFSLTLGVDNKDAAVSFGNTTLDTAVGSASGITARFTVPSGITLGSTSGSHWNCGSVSGGSLSCVYTASLAASMAASSLTLDFTAPGNTGKISVPVSVAASVPQSSSDSSGNSATTTVTVNAASSGGGSSGGGSSSGGGGGGGAFDLLSLAFLGLPLLRRRKSKR